MQLNLSNPLLFNQNKKILYLNDSFEQKSIFYKTQKPNIKILNIETK